uniref:Uncharacterized protein n=1 Tax=Globodera rostochiensis TaxID=31243 RepID=A0A914HGF3_GLORO
MGQAEAWSDIHQQLFDGQSSMADTDRDSSNGEEIVFGTTPLCNVFGVTCDKCNRDCTYENIADERGKGQSFG